MKEDLELDLPSTEIDLALGPGCLFQLQFNLCFLNQSNLSVDDNRDLFNLVC